MTKISLRIAIILQSCYISQTIKISFSVLSGVKLASNLRFKKIIYVQMYPAYLFPLHHYDTILIPNLVPITICSALNQHMLIWMWIRFIEFEHKLRVVLVYTLYNGIPSWYEKSMVWMQSYLLHSLVAETSIFYEAIGAIKSMLKVSSCEVEDVFL